MKKLINIIIILNICLTTTEIEPSSPAPKNTLRPQSFAVSGNIRKIKLNEGFGFKVEKLPDDELKKLRRIKKVNERIIAARKARGMEKQSQLIIASGVPGGTMSYIESTDTVPTAMNLLKLCQALRLDPFLITEAKEWDEVKDRARTDQAKMRLLRSRKCWSQEEAEKHIHIAEAGVEFETKERGSKRTRYTCWEKGTTKPHFGDKIIIAKVLGDDTLFDIPEKFKGDIELNIMKGLAIHTPVGFNLAFYWKQIRGHTPAEVDNIMGLRRGSVSDFLSMYDRKNIAEYYGIDLKPKVRKIKPLKVKEKHAIGEAKGWKYMPEPTKGEVADYLAEHWKELEGKKFTRSELAGKIGVGRRTLQYFTDSHPGTEAFYNFRIKAKRKRLVSGTKALDAGLELPREGPKFMPEARMSKIHTALAENWIRIRGLDIPHIAQMLGIKAVKIYAFCLNNEGAEKFYGITTSMPEEEALPLEETDMKGSMGKRGGAYLSDGIKRERPAISKQKKKKKKKPAPAKPKREKKSAVIQEAPGMEKPIEAAAKGETGERKPIAAEAGVKPSKAQRKKPVREKPSIIRDAVNETARYGLTAEEAESGMPDKEEPQISAERLFKMIAYIDDLFAPVEGIEEKYAAPGISEGLEKIFGVTTEYADNEYLYCLYLAYDVYKNLRLPEGRAYIGREEIDEAIDLLDEILGYDYHEGSEKLRKTTIYLRQVLQLLSATTLCDWDNKEIRDIAYGLTKAMVEDSDKAKSIEKWVRENIDFCLGYGGYWDTQASETISYKRGTSFNRANLIVAMLRSVGMPARYKIMRFDKETFGDAAEHIVAQAFIEDRWVNLASDIFIKDKWVNLKELAGQEIGESEYAYGIEALASEKAKKEDHAERDRMEDFRLKRLSAYNPDNIVKTFVEKEGLIPWKDIPSIWFEPDVKALAQELLKRVDKVKTLVNMLSLHDFKKPIFETSSGKGASLSGLLEFVMEKYGYETESEAFEKIKEITGIRKNGWSREDWGEVVDTLRSICKDEDMERVYTPKELEEYLYSHTVRGHAIDRLVALMGHGKGNKAAFMAVMMASYKQIEDYIYDYCSGFPKPIDIDELKQRIIKRLTKELLLFESGKEVFSIFVDRLILEEVKALVQEDNLRQEPASKTGPLGEFKAQAQILKSA